MPPRPQSLHERFWAKVDRHGPDECWPWLGARTKDGYGVLYAGGRGAGNRRATHVAWEIEHGVPFPAGMDALHTCDYPPCVNVKHLTPGTDADNVHDMWMKGRASAPPLHEGEAHHLAKLTAESAAEIRRLYQKGQRGLGLAALAARFGVSKRSVLQLIQRKTWRNVA